MKRLGRDAAELTAHGLALEPELESIFTALAARWESSGRAVPGRPDEEWTILARRCPWPVG
ncbi:hypothetical protein AMK26_22425 [Streptomyces sp. CB03234]|nr:hypothetical protein AMK26_22425 [Streptomyces sp. CB03234]